MHPFPFNDEQTFIENSRHAAITFTDDSNRTGVHIEDVQQVDGQWQVAGTSGVVMVVAGKGTTMKAARGQAYDRVSNVVMPNMYYRDDIGERWVDGEGDQLHAWGYLH